LGKVGILKINNNLKDSLNKSIELIGGIKSIINSGDRALIKPNLNDFESFTSPELTASLIELLFDNNIKNVFIAESTFGNEFITEKHFEKSGYYEIAKKFNIELINLNKSNVFEKQVKNPLIIDKIKFGEEVEKATKIINIPVMKVHYATGISLCLKNLKGLLSKDEKKHFHEIGLDNAIVDLCNTIKIDLNIIDCTSCMETMGPKGGDIFNMNLLIAGKNAGEVDFIGSKVMGYELDEVNHLKKYLELNTIDTDEITVTGEKLIDVIRPFKKVHIDKIIPDNVSIHNANACCACENALLLSFKFIENPLTENYDIFLGESEKIKAPKKSIAFGSCCDKKNCDIIIKGCPPYPLELNRKIIGNNKKD